MIRNKSVIVNVNQFMSSTHTKTVSNGYTIAFGLVHIHVLSSNFLRLASCR